MHPRGEGYESAVQRRYLIHYTLFVSTAGTTRIINIALAVGPTSPSPWQVHNTLGREGRDLPGLFSNPLLYFPLLLTGIGCGGYSFTTWEHVRLSLAIVAFFIWTISNGNPNISGLLKMVNTLSQIRLLLLPVVSRALWGFSMCCSVKYVLFVGN